MKSINTVLLLSLVFSGAVLAGGQPGQIVVLGVFSDVGFLPDKKAPEAPVTVELGVVDVFTMLNVRTGPGTDHAIIGQLRPGEIVGILGESNGWLQIMYKGRKAWVCGYYVWRPGKKVRNSAIKDEIRRVFGADRVPQGTASESDAPGPVAKPTGPGRRLADGGLAAPLYNQNDIGARYPSGFCGPTSLKMVLGYYGKNVDINYLGLRDVGGATPVYTRGQGAGHQAMLDMLRHCGLSGSTMHHGNSIAWLAQMTRAGCPVVVSVKGNYGAGFYTQGHILVVVGVTSDGRVILNDSAGGKRRIVSGSQFHGAWSSSGRMAIVARP